MQVLEFQRGTLQNLYWKNFGCDACSGHSICLSNQSCAVPTSKCSSSGGPTDCSLSIQLAFSGTDKNLNALNSWYEVENLRQYSLYGLFSDIRDSITGQNGKPFWACVAGIMAVVCMMSSKLSGVFHVPVKITHFLQEAIHFWLFFSC